MMLIFILDTETCNWISYSYFKVAQLIKFSQAAYSNFGATCTHLLKNTMYKCVCQQDISVISDDIVTCCTI